MTGGTSGIGRATAEGLARAGHLVVLPCRDPARAEPVQAAGDVRPMLCDLGSLESIRAFASAFLAAHERLDVLVNSAGVISRERRLTSDGFEATFGVTYLGAYLLTRLLLERLKESAPARIVNVAGRFHRKGRIEFDDLQLERGYGMVRAGAQTMLAKVLFTAELARRLRGSGVTANSLHPGAVRSGLLRDLPWYLRGPAALARPFMQTEAQGARTPLYLATSPEVAEVSGKYFAKQRPVEPAPLAQDDALARRLWEESARLVGLEP